MLPYLRAPPCACATNGLRLYRKWYFLGTQKKGHRLNGPSSSLTVKRGRFAYTTREGGNGLGLAMVHQCIVEEHGGRVALDSRPGEGTRVRLILPGSEEAS